MIFEKVNPAHPDKVADRIAGAIVDLAYSKQESPKIAVEILLGHSECNIIIESSVKFNRAEIVQIVDRIAEQALKIHLLQVPQDYILASNQQIGVHCGDNGIFKGVPTSPEEQLLTNIAARLYNRFGTDGKYIIDTDSNKLIICQSYATDLEIKEILSEYIGDFELVINPLGYWTGGLDVDSGATNRKLGSDLGRAVTGGGINGKDLTKADVTLNIAAHLTAQKYGSPQELVCAIGDYLIDGKPYSDYIKDAKEYIDSIGGFEKLAEWGFIRPEN